MLDDGKGGGEGEVKTGHMHDRRAGRGGGGGSGHRAIVALYVATKISRPVCIHVRAAVNSLL